MKENNGPAGRNCASGTPITGKRGTRSKLLRPLQSSAILYARSLPVLDLILKRRTRVRSMHLRLTDLSLGSVQLELFADPKPERQSKLESALDALRHRYGKGSQSVVQSVSEQYSGYDCTFTARLTTVLTADCTTDYRLCSLICTYTPTFRSAEAQAESKSSWMQLLARGMSAMALTDINGVYGLIWFLQYAAERGLRPIVGAELRTEQERATLLVRNRNGYETLCRIISRRQFDPEFCLSRALMEHRENLIVISDQIPLLQALGKQNGTAQIYVELNDPGTEAPLLKFSQESGIPPVATNDVYFVDPSDFPLHRLLRAIDLNTCLSRIPPERAGERRSLAEAGGGDGPPVSACCESDGQHAAHCLRLLRGSGYRAVCVPVV